MVVQPSPSPRAPLSARKIDEIASRLEYVRLKGVGDTLEDQGESKGLYILGALEDIASGLEETDVLPQRLPSLKYLIRELTASISKEGKTLLSAAQKARVDEVVKPLGTAWNDYLIEHNFIDTRPDVGMFDYSKLVADGVGTVFSDPNLRSRVSSAVLGDTQQATDCLRSGLYTASVMLALRAAEGALRDAYLIQLKVPAGPKDKWYDVADDLFKALRTRQVDTSLLEGYVNGLRMTRNSAMHPGDMFDVSAAEDALVNLRQLVQRLDRLPKPP